MDFPGNTNKENTPKTPAKKEIVKVTTGEVIKRKTSLGKRLRGMFFGGEFRSASTYITSVVLLPALKNMVVDATSKGVERIIYGEARGPGAGYPTTGRPRTSYNMPIDRYSGRNRPGILPDQPPLQRQVSRRPDSGEIVVSSREESEVVIERLTDIIDTYNVASVADLHDLVGLPTTHVDNKWGWTSMAYANVRQIREGYLIELPPVEPI